MDQKQLSLANLQITVTPAQSADVFPCTDIRCPEHDSPFNLELMMFGRFTGRSNRFQGILCYVSFWMIMASACIAIGYGVSKDKRIIPVLLISTFASLVWFIAFTLIHLHLANHSRHLREFLLKVQERHAERELCNSRLSISSSSDGRSKHSSRRESVEVATIPSFQLDLK